MIWIVTGAVLALVALHFWSRRRGSVSRAGALLLLRRRLRRLTRDPSVAERLIAAERAKHPELSELALLRKVIRRLQRDRR